MANSQFKKMSFAWSGICVHFQNLIRYKGGWVINIAPHLLSYHGLLDHLLKKRLGIRACLLLTLTNLQFCHQIFVCIYLIVNGATPGDVISQITVVIELFNVIYMVNVCLFGGKIISFCLKILENASEKSWTFLKVYQLILLINNAGRVVQKVALCVKSDDNDIKEYVEDEFYNLTFLKTHTNVGRLVRLLDHATYFYITSILGFLFQATVCFTADSLRVQVLNLTKKLSENDIRQFALQHTALFEATQKLDSLLKWILCGWLVEFAGNFYYYLLKYHEDTEIGYLEVILYTISVNSLFVVLLSVTLVSDSKVVLLRAYHLRFARTPRRFKMEQTTMDRFCQRKIDSAILHFTVLRSAVLYPGFLGGLIVSIVSYATFVLSVDKPKVMQIGFDSNNFRDH